MKSRPILFSTPMVQAILEGRKTQTRRVVKVPIKPMEEVMCTTETNPNDPEFSGFYLVKNSFTIHTKSKYAQELCHLGQVNDVLWVRETWQNSANNVYYHYKADFTEPGKGWKPSIFMPKDAARIWLKITAIRVERLNQILDEDAIKEGIEEVESKLIPHYRNYGKQLIAEDYNFFCSAVNSFRSLWESINGDGSWKQNPWVWVIEFERIEKPSEV